MASRHEHCLGKYEWPELVGAKADYAVATIERENHRVRAIVVPPDHLVIQDYRCDRVWVWVDKDNIVIHVPKIG